MIKQAKPAAAFQKESQKALSSSTGEFSCKNFDGSYSFSYFLPGSGVSH